MRKLDIKLLRYSTKKYYNTTLINKIKVPEKRTLYKNVNASELWQAKIRNDIPQFQ